MRSITLAAALIAVSLCKLTTAPFFYNKTRPLVLAHRGASG